MPFLANIIDVSPLTLLVVLILALLILGPGKLPEVAGALGKSIKEFRRTSSEIADSVNLSTAPITAPTATAPADATASAPAGVAAPPAASGTEPAAGAVAAAAVPPVDDPNEKIRMLEERLAALEQERSAPTTHSPS